jgi:hypothetical protein
MARHRWLLFVAFLMVMLAATPAVASGKFSFRGGHGLHGGFHGGHRLHGGFHRQHPHVGRPFSFGVPHHHRFGQPFGFHRNPKFFHSPFKHHHFSPHIWRR